MGVHLIEHLEDEIDALQEPDLPGVARQRVPQPPDFFHHGGQIFHVHGGSEAGVNYFANFLIL